MPRRDDLSSILVIGSGPIIIGQACEFDYSGTQAIKVLREEGYRVILVNSNPATIMTDPEFADATYIEPITPEVVAAIIEKERPDALLPTLGGQTALNVTMSLHNNGVLEKLGVELIGAGIEAIETAEDRGRFKAAMDAVGIATARATYARSMEEALAAAEDIGYPLMIRPSYILGGGGTGLAADEREFRQTVANGLDASPVGEVLVEESVYGWKEFELEVMRDRADNAVIVCSIENLDAMGVHTGDSITVAPIQTLSDREYQEMRDEAISCLRVIGVETGGSNVQFAVDPATGRRIVVEMNPRVSRSSALASKATGFPIAKIAAKLAVGYTLDEIANDITGKTPASFEPALDYVVVKAPRFDFAKFPTTSPELGTSMRSVGESMAIGRTFPEALQKALRSLETGRKGLLADGWDRDYHELDLSELVARTATPTPDRIHAVAAALHRGATIGDVNEASKIDPWFLDQILQIVELRDLVEASPTDLELTRLAKRFGFSDEQLALLTASDPKTIRRRRLAAGIRKTFKTVDTCAAEFEAQTPYFYGTFEEEDEAPTPGERTVVVLGSGPNRIGQGIEFDYCCVHASFALRDAGYEPVMVNCNPETVSTDYDTSDRLYFEPLTVEDVLAVVEAEQPTAVIVQLGGQTPLNLAHALADAGVRIAGTQPDAIDMAEDRERFADLCDRIDVKQPPGGTATSVADAVRVVDRVGLPALVRPSYVLGGRAMRVVYTVDELSEYLRDLYGAVPGGEIDLSDSPLLIDRFLESATEVDVDAIYDGEELLVGGIMEHIEQAGVHSGDSACVVPPPTLSAAAQRTIAEYTRRLADGLEVRGPLNIQFAVQDEEVYVLEANPRGSRTLPFISKATGTQLAKVATRVMMGESIATLRLAGMIPEAAQPPAYVSVKEAVLPWRRFPDEDVVLGPEMRSTGEVMGIGPDLGTAFGKALSGAGHEIPTSGTVFISVADEDKAAAVEVARTISAMGYRIVATYGTASRLATHKIESTGIAKVGEGAWDPARMIEAGDIDMVFNTPRGSRARGDGAIIRQAAHRHKIPCVTTIEGALAVTKSLASLRSGESTVKSLQDHHAG